MKNLQQNLATVPDDQMATTCFVCQKQIVDGQFFCRLPQKVDGAAAPSEAKILLCSPSCAYRYFAFFEIGASQI